MESEGIISSDSENIHANVSTDGQTNKLSPHEYLGRDAKQLDDLARKPFADKLFKLINNGAVTKHETIKQSNFKRVNSSVSLRGKSIGKESN